VEIPGTVVPVLAELDGVEPENVPGLLVEPGTVPAVVGVTEPEVVSVGRAVAEVVGVVVVEKLVLPPLPDKPEEDLEELLPPRPEPDKPDPPADGVEVVEKPLLPLLLPLLPVNPEEPELPPKPAPDEPELPPRPEPEEPDPPAAGVEVVEKPLLPLLPPLLADNPDDPELLPRPVPEEAEGVELDEVLLPPLAVDPELREPLPWPPLSEPEDPGWPPPKVFDEPDPADEVLE
jgi:hypothetical protein